jgi:small subunit ribosomal protein S25e
MGGSKNISPAQKEKKQQRGSDAKKDKKDNKGDKNKKAEISVILNETDAEKIIKNAKIITLYDFARQTGVKISTANEFLQKSLKNGTIKKIGGFSGHHVYQPISE